MTQVRMDSVLDWITMQAIAGPIFEKELLVASRRMRYYLLRIAFITVIGGMVLLSWMATIRPGGSRIVTASRMSEVSRYVTTALVIFEFIILPLLAAVMLGSAINEEIRKGTLATLLTTPITHGQLVAGKLLSRLLQLALLMAMSLPLLAILRVFGGVPWDAVWPAVIVILTTTVLAGSVSLCFSVSCKHAHQSILRTIGIFWLVYWVGGLLSILIPQWIQQGYIPSWFSTVGWLLTLLNPYTAFADTIRGLLPMTGRLPFLPWFWHCAASAAISAGILLWTSLRVRKAMIRQAFDPSRVGLSGKGWKAREHSLPIRTVIGAPVTWKDLRSTIRDKSRYPKLAFAFAGILLVAYYAAGLWFRAWKEPAYHIAFVEIVLLLGLMRMTIDAAGTIAREKEGRTLTMLLMTPMTDGQILRQKAMAIVRKSLPVWGILAGHLLVFSALGYLHPLAIPGTVITIASVAMFLMGLGFFFSSICRSSTAAITWSCAIPLVSWFMNPFLLFANPGLWIGFILSDHMAWNHGGYFQVTVFLVLTLVYSLLGAVLAAISIPMMRNRLFSTLA